MNAVDEEVEIQVLPSQLDDVLRETDRLESDVNFSRTGRPRDDAPVIVYEHIPGSPAAARGRRGAGMSCASAC